jgi:hypothetical protein
VVPARVSHPITVKQFEGLADYQAAVGGTIEAVDIKRLGLTLYVNEEGLLRQLELNSRATFLWWYHVPEARQRAMLVGDAVFIGYPDDEGNTTDLPPGLLALFTEPGEFWVEVQWTPVDGWVRVLSDYNDYFDAITWGMIANERFEPFQLKVVGQFGVSPIGGSPSG